MKREPFKFQNCKRQMALHLKNSQFLLPYFTHFSFREVNIDQTVEERSHCQRGKKLSGNFQPFSFNLTFDNKVAQSLIQTENSIVANKLDPDQKKQTRRMPNIKVFSGRFSASFYSILQFKIGTLRCQLNEQGQINEQGGYF